MTEDSWFVRRDQELREHCKMQLNQSLRKEFQKATVNSLNALRARTPNHACYYHVDIVVAHHKIPESFRALFNIVSFTAANTNRIFDVLVACVKLGRRQSRPVESSVEEE